MTSSSSDGADVAVAGDEAMASTTSAPTISAAAASAAIIVVPTNVAKAEEEDGEEKDEVVDDDDDDDDDDWSFLRDDVPATDDMTTATKVIAAAATADVNVGVGVEDQGRGGEGPGRRSIDDLCRNGHGDGDCDATSSSPPSSFHRKYAGCLHVISLLLNSCLMLYAHLGPLGMIYSSRDPTSSSLSSSPSINAGATTTSDGNSSSVVVGGTGKCVSESDLLSYRNAGGTLRRPHMSNYCSREYLGNGCLLDGVCIEECFAMTYNFTEDCSTCFGAIPLCSVANGCMEVW
jgi:hypothetical protein